ncbi:RagB/SusD family nutrient uptake outer membrane protein [Mariniflexile sp. AS56]|uniref:RagB/SusD family nutrient uptake outer membrane protein n=1 Tax=Mariniflexile sp. AS56 TaxID=3063957 RepID=UPI0026F190E7|nr:RagB/SusD family nutrient uptake outer membrane protein [Mariniflexile sp. AS56]MDO7171751.1 RagB/SusD family nutrient uptake outer membrane protein [Mariniflexile sp. AS56]
MKTKHFYRKAKKSLLLILAMFLAVSCQDFLEEQPSTSIDAGYIYNTEAGLQSGVVSLYAFNRERYEIDEQDYMGGPILSALGDLTLNRSGYAGSIGRYTRNIAPSGDLGAQFMSRLFWKQFYKIANKATDIINAAEVVDGISEKSRNQIIAEAKFFRADAYFYLYRMYNNIYVTTESVTVENAFNVIQDKSSKEGIYALINSDLAFAIEHLEWNVIFGRVSKGTAKHVKAQVAMTQGDWPEAKKQALDVIEDPNSPHKLVATTADVFKGDRNHSEQLFVIQAQDDVLGGGSVNMLNAYYIAQYFQLDGSKEVGPDLSQGGIGFSRILPNRYLLGLLAEDPNDTRDDDTYFRLKFFYNKGPRSGQQITEFRRKETETSAIPNGELINYYRYIAPSCIKFAQDDDIVDSYRQRSHIMVYRLAETYLIAAEAILRSGSGDPLPYFNEIRKRANATEKSSITLQDILDENARELSFEGQRWFTLKRFGQATMDFQMTTYSGDGPYAPSFFATTQNSRLNWRSYYINMPIFQEDIDLFGPNYPQNDGYTN